MAKKRFSTIGKILFLQLLVVFLVPLLFAITKGQLYFCHALLGGLTAFMPNLYFSLKVRHSQGQDAQKIVRTFYSGESGKLLLTAALFAIIFHQVPNVMFLPLMTAYVSVLSIFWFALILRD